MKVGRKKLDDTSERITRVNITLKPSQIEWLKKQGGISQTIQQLIDEKQNKAA
jgi:hypothetical protein